MTERTTKMAMFYDVVSLAASEYHNTTEAPDPYLTCVSCAELSLQAGAFGVTKRKNETRKQAVRRIAQEFMAAVEETTERATAR